MPVETKIPAPKELTPEEIEAKRIYDEGIDNAQIYVDDINSRLEQARTPYEKEKAELARQRLNLALGRAGVGGTDGIGIRLINDPDYKGVQGARNLSFVVTRSQDKVT